MEDHTTTMSTLPEIRYTPEQLAELVRDAKRFRKFQRCRYLAWNGREAFVQIDSASHIKAKNLADLADKLPEAQP